ncbi:MAG: hypothetical protein JSW47_22725 [Phycisphaerales bacterium]|nr:MAG: hypothetical protein JSW47_22725 [Phycisphaerales bacterium]
MKKNPLNMDERNLNITCRICTVMYLITLAALMGIMIVRQFTFDQPVDQFEDIAILVTANVIFLVGAILYFGGVTFGKLKIRFILAGYVIYVVVGFAFTFVKYRFLTDPPLSLGQTFGKLNIIVTICGLLVAGFALFAYLGRRKVEKDLG